MVKPTKKITTNAVEDNTPRSSANRNHYYRALFRLSDLVNTTQNSATLLRRILREFIENFDAQGGIIAFTDRDGSNLKLELNQGLDSRTYKTGAALSDKHLLRQAVEARTVVQHPVKGSDHTDIAAVLQFESSVIGGIMVRSSRSKPFPADDVRLMTALAGQAARIISTSRNYDQMNQHCRALEEMVGKAEYLISTDPLPVVLNRVTESLLGILEVKQCTVLLVGKGNDLQLSASSGGAGHYVQRREISDNPSDALPHRGSAVRVVDVRKPAGRKPGKLPRQQRLSTLLAVPITYQERLVAILNVYTENPREFSNDEMRLLKAYANLCGIAIANARKHELLLLASEEIRLADRASTMHALSSETTRVVKNALTTNYLLLDSLHEMGIFPAERTTDYEVLLGELDKINLTLGRVEALAGRRMPQLEWQEPNRLIEDVLSLCQHRLAARQIRIHRRLTSDLPRILVDRAEILLVLMHLVTNAIESMHHGGIMNIATSLLPQDEDNSAHPMIRINVRDTGTGLDPQVAEELFDPISRRDGSRAGVGLFVAWKIVQKYGGRLTARNAVDHGTSVSITIPSLEDE